MPACFGPEFDQKGQPSVACICMWRLCHAGKMSGKLEILQVFHECCGLQPSTGPPCLCAHPWKLEFNPSISLSVFEDAGMFWTWIWPKGSTFSGVYLHVKIVPCRENEWQTYFFIFRWEPHFFRFATLESGWWIFLEKSERESSRIPVFCFGGWTLQKQGL